MSTSPTTIGPPEAYWIETVAPFRHAPRFLPHVIAAGLPSAAAGDAHARLGAGDGDSIDVIALAALMLVTGRYNGNEPALIVMPSRDDDGRVRFVSSAAVTAAQDVRTLVARVRAEFERASAQPAVAIGALASALGIDAAAQENLLQLALISGDGAAALRARAGVVCALAPTPDGVTVSVSGRSSAFPKALHGQLAAHVARAIEWLASHAESRLDEFDLLSSAEQQLVTTGFAGKRVDLPAGLTIHGLIESQALRTPSASAVIFRDTTLTYQDLDERANRLAALLKRSFNVEPGACVGVMMDRSEHMIVALYGVMKAGAAYVPINPRHPWETVRYMIDNAGIQVLIVDAESIAAASNFSGELIVIDIELAAAPAADAPAVKAADTDLAYVIYTSGSTGRPKGGAIEHRAAVNTILWRNDFYGIGPFDINLQIPSFAFDSSVVDIFCVLTAGGTLVIPEESLRLDARRLIELSAARQITSCVVTPSYYKLLLNEFAGAVPSLRWVTLAGESATLELVSAHLQRLPNVILYNEYGPTENAVCSTACRLERLEATVPIGRAIWNVDVAILDASGRLAPIGVPGEIYLGGAGLARGYLNQPELTAGSFVSSPRPDVLPGRWYRTGDRGAWRPDGSLEFLGRFDSQVKIRGFRIELGEVEQALRRCSGVRSAAVLCKHDGGGAPYLAAYVEPSGPLTRGTLDDHMRHQVPHYMVPDVIRILPALPLNLNAKIDRQALAEYDDFDGGDAVDAAALSPLQSTLIGMWADVLKRAPIALDDNFFALGGNSLRVMELTSRIRGELSHGVELIDIYSYPTPRELAARLTRADN